VTIGKPELMRHFGLTRDPFAAPCGPAELWPGAALAQAEDLLRHAVAQREIVAILGDIGTGKTTLAFSAAARLSRGANNTAGRLPRGADGAAERSSRGANNAAGRSSRGANNAAAGRLGTRARLVPIAGDTPALRIAHVIETCLRELGVQALPHGETARRRRLNGCWRELRAAGETALLMLDEAHRLSGELLKGLKELHEQSRWVMEAATFAVVLTGHRQLVTAYEAAAPDVLQRLEAHNILRVGRLLPVQAKAYVLHRLAAAGAAQLAEARALDGCWRGPATPLEIHALLWRLLEAAARAGERRLTAGRVAAELGEHGQGKRGRPDRAARVTALLNGALLNGALLDGALLNGKGGHAEEEAAEG